MNVVFIALPTFAICSFLLPKTVVKKIDKFMKHCLWCGPNHERKKPSKAAWQMVCVPKVKGGLGGSQFTDTESMPVAQEFT